MASLSEDQQILSNSTEQTQRGESHDDSVEKKVAPNIKNANASSLTHRPNDDYSSETTLHWFAQVGSSQDDDALNEAIRDRDEKLKLTRERQNEERLRRIEEMKAQAVAAQKYREQREEERRRRMDELKQRDSEKRHQVEERKRAIMEAEKERREYILKKNQDRDTRIDAKRRERSSPVFAFGSSTPRLLEPADFGTVSPSTFWGHRRSTSISNVAGASLSRRSSERELSDSGVKKRATSICGPERHDEDNVDTSQIVFRSVARRKTDLMPTIPSPRDGHGHYSSRSSLSNTPRTPGSRSGNVTPGGSTSRPGSAMSTSTTLSTSVTRRSVTTPRKQRPASIAGTGVSLDEINKQKKDNKLPLKNTTPSASTQSTPKRLPGLMSTSMIVTSSRMSTEKKTPTKRETPYTPKYSSPKPLSKTASSERLNKPNRDKLKDVQVSAMTKSAIVPSNSSVPAEKTPAPVASKAEDALINVGGGDVINNKAPPEPDGYVREKAQVLETESQSAIEMPQESSALATAEIIADVKAAGDSKESSATRELSPPMQMDSADAMTASMIARNKITTEQEAKAALAERRRLAREEAERQAELERQRIEAERLAELKRQEEEAERQRQFEEEAMRLAELQRKAEEERLRQAIEEARQREEEERRKRDEDERQRLEREEAEKKVKEEIERQRIETDERLKREEIEREVRRKRVEAIMSRTRKGGAATNTPNSTPVKENTESIKTAPASNNKQLQQHQQNQQQQQKPGSISSESSSSGSTTTATTPTPIPNQMPAPFLVEPLDSQLIYEQSVNEKEAALINCFANMIIDENAKNLQQHQQPQNAEVTNGKLHAEYANTTAVANGNGHIENVSNKNDINILQDVVTPATNQLIDLSIESQDINNAVNFNNNNSLLTTTTTLVTADSHENKDISLL